MSEVLWRPSDADVQNANVQAFLRALKTSRGVELADWPALHRWSIERPETFWEAIWDFAGVRAEERGATTLRTGDRLSSARWFPDARLNFAGNLLRRRDTAPAIVFRGEDGARRELTFADLHREVSRLAAALRQAGVVAGDRVAACLPNIPETVIAMLATASLGAVWSSCSPDFGEQGVLDRFGQIEPKVLFGVDGYRYGGKVHRTLDRLAAVVARLPKVERTVVVPHVGDAASLESIRSAVWLDSFTEGVAETGIDFVSLPFNQPLYIMFSSGTTGVPKCIVHGAGGTLLQHLKEHLLHVDIKPLDRMFYFTTCGWMMWNWLVTGLAAEATLLLYDGSPFHPDGNALFDIADQEKMTIFGTSAKYIDAVAKAGLTPRQTHDLSSVRTILSTGSPLAPEAFDFVYDRVKSDVRLCSISGGTDIVSCFALGSPVLPIRRGELQCRGLGMRVEVFSEAGRPLVGEKGELVCTAPFPSMPLGFGSDPDGSRFQEAYFERFPGAWHHGDYVEQTDEGGMIFHGRSDAVLNPGGVRIGTAEIYRQVEQLDEVVESIVAGQQWQGDERVVLFVKLRDGQELDRGLCDRIRAWIRGNATPRHVPAKILQVREIPRTRSGKIVELAVRDVIHGRPVRNLEALANPQALEQFRDRPELQSD